MLRRHHSLVGLGSSDGHEFTDDELRLLAVLLVKSVASVKGLDPAGDIL